MAPIVAANDAKRDMSRNPCCGPAALQPGDPVGVALLARVARTATPRELLRLLVLVIVDQMVTVGPGAGGR
jgi:hypothetical protein